MSVILAEITFSGRNGSLGLNLLLLPATLDRLPPKEEEEEEEENEENEEEEKDVVVDGGITNEGIKEGVFTRIDEGASAGVGAGGDT